MQRSKSMDCPLHNKPCSAVKNLQFMVSSDEILKIFNICQGCMSDYEIKDQIFNSCTSCETSLFEIKKDKKFGCANCYVYFKNYAERFFSVCQVGTKHVGKVPSLSNSFTIDQLRKKMNEAIIEENYELANEYKKIISQKSNQPNLEDL